MPYCGRRAGQRCTDAVLPAPPLPECDDLLCRGRLKSHPFLFFLLENERLLCCLLETTVTPGGARAPSQPTRLR